MKETEREYDQALAHARIDAAEAGIAANDRRYYADVTPAVKRTREAKDLAEVSFKYAEERLRGIHAAIRAWQSVGTSVRQAYATSHIG